MQEAQNKEDARDVAIKAVYRLIEFVGYGVKDKPKREKLRAVIDVLRVV